MRLFPGAEGGSRKGEATAPFHFSGGEGELVAIVVRTAVESRHKGGQHQREPFKGRVESEGRKGGGEQRAIRQNGRGLQGRTQGRSLGSSKVSSATTLLTIGSGCTVSTAVPAVRTAVTGKSGGTKGIVRHTRRRTCLTRNSPKGKSGGKRKTAKSQQLTEEGSRGSPARSYRRVAVL